jgi:hypothetical protein
MNIKNDKAVKHVIQTLLAQIIDVNNHVRSVQDNKELSHGDKVVTTNFAHYHLMVLCVLLKDLEGIARESFPDARGIIDWAMDHYENGLKNKSFKKCECIDCKEEDVVSEHKEPSVEATL